jgi:hypothetical protein
LLWQAAYAELVFDDTPWPDFDRRNLWAACVSYAQRTRRFGSAGPVEGGAAAGPVESDTSDPSATAPSAIGDRPAAPTAPDA